MFKSSLKLILFTLGYLVTLAYAEEIPHAHMVRWAPGIVASGSILSQNQHLQRQQAQMPVWVTITFDKIASYEYVKNYCDLLHNENKNINLYGTPQAHGKDPNHFVIVVDRSVIQDEFKSLLEKVNRHFDPEIEKQEKIAQAEAKEKEEKLTQEKAIKDAEIALAAMQLKIKLEKEKKAQEEQRALALLKAEEARREQNAKRKRDEENQKNIAEEADKRKDIRHYDIQPLPGNFYAFTKHALNNKGEVAGCIAAPDIIVTFNADYSGAQAACWHPQKGIQQLSFDCFKSIAMALNDNGLAAVNVYELEPSQRNSKVKCGIWHPNNNQFKMGPTGLTNYITNNSLIVYGAANAWDYTNNNIRSISNPEKILCNNSMVNKNGSQIEQFFPDLIVCNQNKKYILLLNEGEFISNGTPSVRRPHLNDNDNVIVINKLKIGCKNYHTITQWESPISQTRSVILENTPELSEYKEFEIISYNNNNQILLRAYKSDHINLSPSRLFLLSPKDLIN